MRKALKILVVIFASCLALIMPLGITNAYYSAKRSANANLIMDKGIFIEFGNVQGEGLSCKIQTITNEELNLSVLPNDKIQIKNPYIKVLENSVDIFLKARLNYKYYSNEIEIFPEGNILEEIFVLNENQPIKFNEKLQPDDEFEWFYYSKNSGDLETLKPSETLEIFDNPELQIANFTAEKGSPSEVTKIEIYLEIQVIQANAESENEFYPNEAMTSIIKLNNECVMEYKIFNMSLEVLSITGTEPEISTEISQTYSEVIFDAKNLEGEILYVSDEKFILNLTIESLESWIQNEKWIIIPTELYSYIQNDYKDPRTTKLANYLDACIFDISSI